MMTRRSAVFMEMSTRTSAGILFSAVVHHPHTRRLADAEDQPSRVFVVVLLQDDMLHGRTRVPQAAVERTSRVDGIGSRGAVQQLDRLKRTIRSMCGGCPERAAVGQCRRVAGGHACP